MEVQSMGFQIFIQAALDNLLFKHIWFFISSYCSFIIFQVICRVTSCFEEDCTWCALDSEPYKPEIVVSCHAELSLWSDEPITMSVTQLLFCMAYNMGLFNMVSDNKLDVLINYYIQSDLTKTCDRKLQYHYDYVFEMQVNYSIMLSY